MVPSPSNEPVKTYAPGTAERQELAREIERRAGAPVDVPLFVDGVAVHTVGPEFSAPHRHALRLGRVAQASPGHVAAAIAAAGRARHEWAGLPQDARSAVFLRAAELAAGPWRQRLNAATLLNQSKTVQQAEIDSACELVDFFRFNVAFADRLAEQPLSPAGAWNRSEARPLDGFVYAVTPFNFTAIAANLPTAPALLGNTVVWKPSPLAALSGHVVMELLIAAGLPAGVVNLVQGDPAAITAQVLAAPSFAGLHYTGSSAVFRAIWADIGAGLSRYRCYPRIVGETGGKDFILAHPSADLDALAVAIVRGGFEYQGQKCSAASRVYVPRSCWPDVEERVRAMTADLKMGDPADFSCFLGAVIGRTAFERITRYQALARADAGCRLVVGGGSDDREGYFVEPTLVAVSDPRHALMREEIFGPVVSLFVYDDARFDETVALVDEADYALTGAVFCTDRAVLARLERDLRFAAGNYYVNDKPTGAVVGQQPFGGGRLSGTNDKAGSAANLARWVSFRTIKETLVPARDWRYPHQA